MNTGYTVVSNTVRSGIKSLLRRLKKPDYTIHFVGQSLGGSVASLAAMDVSLHMPEIADRIRLYTYGQPRYIPHLFPQPINLLTINRKQNWKQGVGRMDEHPLLKPDPPRDPVPRLCPPSPTPPNGILAL